MLYVVVGKNYYTDMVVTDIWVWLECKFVWLGIVALW
jgi:hypothetical protein